MEPQSNDQQQAATAGQDAGMTERAPATAELGQHAGTASGVTAGAAESAPVAAHGRHKPIIEWREFASSTAALARRAPDLRAIWFDGRLDPAFREEVMLAVAGANSCRQCSFAHREWALAEGLPEAELAALEGLQAESFDAQKWAAIAWAQAAAGSDFADVPDAIEANFRRRFSAQEQADIELVARTMTWMNRDSNTVDAALSRLKGRPVPGSGVPAELTALLIYGVVTPIVLVLLSIKQRRRPISFIRSVRPFFRTFEARGPDTISGPGENYGG